MKEINLKITLDDGIEISVPPIILSTIEIIAVAKSLDNLSQKLLNETRNDIKITELKD